MPLAVTTCHRHGLPVGRVQAIALAPDDATPHRLLTIALESGPLPLDDLLAWEAGVAVVAAATEAGAT